MRAGLCALTACVVVLAACAAGPRDSADGRRIRDVTYPPDSVGLTERLLAGNIDQPGSPAFNRWGPGYVQGIAASDSKFERPATAP